ncbi:MAG: hypothetical protein ACOCXA_01835 [Planctomycetota bacterium]
MVGNNTRASAVVMCVGLVVLMATLATAFLATISRTRGATRGHEQRAVLDLELDRLRHDVIAKLQAAGLDHASDITVQSQDWYRDYQAVDVNGLHAWHIDWQDGGGPSEDPAVNVPWTEDPRLDPMLTDGGFWQPAFPTGVYYQAGLPLVRRVERGDFSLDANLQPIMDASGNTRDGGRYEIRQVAMNLDANAMLSLHPDWPVALPGMAADEKVLSWASYAQHYGGMIRSQAAALSQAPTGISWHGHASDSPVFFDAWPFRRQIEGLGLDGELAHDKLRDNANSDNYPAGNNGQRALLYEGLFRRIGLAPRAGILNSDKSTIYATGPTKNYATSWTQFAPTGLYTPQQLMGFGEQSQGGGKNFDVPPVYWFGFAPGLRAGQPGMTGDRQAACNTPWRINLLTATPATLQAMINSLSEATSLVGGRNPFGDHYPDPFPLRHNEGRFVPVALEKDSERGYLLMRDFGNGQGGAMRYATQGQAGKSDAAQHSYLRDLRQALDLALFAQRVVYVLHTDSNQLADKLPAACLLKTSEPPTEPNEIIANLLDEVYRIMGEEVQGGSSGRPATSNGLLQKRTGPVGWPGGADSWRSNQQIEHTIRKINKPRGESVEYLTADAVLPSGVNTRALEYALNDIMISLFGAANPAWFRAGSADEMAGRAVDFNGDGMAESTLTGWWDGSRRVFSFWWQGLGPEEGLDANVFNASNDLPSGVEPWMLQPAWYRIYAADDVHRRAGGGSWEPLTAMERNTMKQATEPFLSWSGFPSDSMPGTDNGTPIRPYAHSGRLVAGPSDSFHLLLRVELVDTVTNQVVQRLDEFGMYHRDPNRDGDADDGHFVYRRRYTPNAYSAADLKLD